MLSVLINFWKDTRNVHLLAHVDVFIFWHGFWNAKLIRLRYKLIHLRYLPSDNPTYEKLCNQADTQPFSNVEVGAGHVSYGLLPSQEMAKSAQSDITRSW